MSSSGINIHCCEINEPLGFLDLMQTSAKRKMHQRWCIISTSPPLAANPVLLNCTAPKRDMTRQVHYISLTRVFGQPCDVPLRPPPLLMVSPTSVLTELFVSDASEGCTVSVHLLPCRFWGHVPLTSGVMWRQKALLIGENGTTLGALETSLFSRSFILC